MAKLDHHNSLDENISPLKTNFDGKKMFLSALIKSY